MGFYGNVFYQLTNAFGKLGIKNDGLTKEQFPSEVSNEKTISAIGLESSVEMNTGNKWIKLDSDPEEATITIYHAPIDETTEDKLKINAFKVEDGVGAVELQPGMCVATPVFSYDKAGHIIGVDSFDYFKLPFTDFEANLEEIQTNISNLQKNDNKQDDAITTLDERCAKEDEALAERCSKLEEKNNFLGDKTSYTTEDSDLTVTSSLGDMDAMREKYTPTLIYDKNNDYVWDGDSLTVSKAILDLDTRVKKNKKDISILGLDQEEQLETAQKTVIPAINGLNSQVVTALAGVGVLTGLFDTIQSTMTDLNNEITSLKQRVEELEKKMNE